ncbi:oxidoreductase [Oleomonas cavernae]|uniref:oxidoreductase n=1 Tax=Oleomonas cavernae TaxID=2320859 RepID=UPI0018F73004|nr:oxidoreductase [Oleomonas cavernae]
MAGWGVKDIPDLAGKVAVVTGANSGLGWHTAAGLAARGAHVVLACRDKVKTQAAIAGIKAITPEASLEFMALDLANLASIGSFAESFKRAHPRLDILCNNAGVMFLPFRETADGFEMQMGTNHLGHFALTGRLLDIIAATPGSRIVTLSSGFANFGQLPLDDLNSTRGYSRYRAYANAKLANLVFALELQRRLGQAGKETISLAAHPGYAATNLQGAGPAMSGSALVRALGDIGARFANAVFAQDAASGALPTLYAATAPDVAGGDYCGPKGALEMRGARARSASPSVPSIRPRPPACGRNRRN